MLDMSGIMLLVFDIPRPPETTVYIMFLMVICSAVCYDLPRPPEVLLDAPLHGYLEAAQ